MKLQRLSGWFGLVGVLIFLTACASQTGCGTGAAEPVAIPEEPEPVEQPVVPVEVEPIPDFKRLPDGSLVAVSADGSPLRAVFQFDYDESDILGGDFRLLQEHAQRLNRNRNQVVSIQGHCDERGTREYNLALGERRANTVQDFLLANGVRPSQVSTQSYGEEQPVDSASTEAAWAKNRRVELVYE